jgi:hypothetical protein
MTKGLIIGLSLSAVLWLLIALGCRLVLLALGVVA